MDLVGASRHNGRHQHDDDHDRNPHPIQTSISTLPATTRPGTIRQMFCGVNPRSIAAAELPLSQIDSPSPRSLRKHKTHRVRLLTGGDQIGAVSCTGRGPFVGSFPLRGILAFRALPSRGPNNIQTFPTSGGWY